jgi:hypothetical protein
MLTSVFPMLLNGCSYYVLTFTCMDCKSLVPLNHNNLGDIVPNRTKPKRSECCGIATILGGDAVREAPWK